MKQFMVITCKKLYTFHVSSFHFIAGKLAMQLAADGLIKIIDAEDVLCVEMAYGIPNGDFKVIK